MAICPKCLGEGELSYEEDGRIVTDACYHCSTSGQVDDETFFHDQLHAVANTLAYQDESEYRRYLDSNDNAEGEPYYFHAAENMMSAEDYFRTRVWDREYEIEQSLHKMTREQQEVLVAWNELPWIPIITSQAEKDKAEWLQGLLKPSSDQNSSEDLGDEIPF